MPTLVLLRHGQSQWNLENRFTGWWDVDLSATRASTRPARPAAAARQGLRLRLLLHQRPHPRHPHAAPRAARDGPAVASGDQGLAPERAPLWRADRPQQAGDDRQGRGRAGQDLAPLLRHPAAAAAATTAPTTSAATAATPASPCRDREPQGHDRPGAALLRGARSRRRFAPASASWSPPTAIRCAGSSNICRTSATTRSSAWKSRPASRSSTTSRDDLSVERRYYLDEALSRRPCGGTFPRRREP